MAFFGVSALLFACGVGLVVVAAATARRAPARTPVETVRPIASMTQIMRGVVDPAATVVFDAVGTTVTASGIDEKAPQTQDEWNRVADSAAALAEAGNMLLVEGRAVDRDAWSTWSRTLIEGGSAALAAAEARDAAGVFASGETIYAACDNCHSTYRRTE
jgi:cytochrome c556